MNYTSIPSALDEISEARHAASFKKGYPKNSDTLREALGLAIASYCDWSGVKIMSIFVSALEDANYHQCAGVIQAWIDGEAKPLTMRERLLDYRNVEGVPELAVEMARAYNDYKADPVTGEIAVQFFRSMFPDDNEYYKVINGITKHSIRGEK
jgi:hypothetical protein